MSHIAWSVCLSVITLICCVKMDEPIEMLFGLLSLEGSKNHVVDGGQEAHLNPFAAMQSDKSAMWPFAKLLWTFVIITQ